MQQLRIGSIIAFSYPAVHLQGTKAHDKFPQTLVLHPNWQGLMHGLNFNYLTDDEINALRMLIDPMFEEKYIEALQRKNPRLVQELDRIALHLGNANITSPHDFYVRAIRPFIMSRGWDPYRKYRPDKMTAVRVIQRPEAIQGKSRMANMFLKNLRDRDSTESKIVQNVAQKFVDKDLTAQQQRFVRRLQGDLRRIFMDYVRKFEHAKGPQLPRFDFTKR